MKKLKTFWLIALLLPLLFSCSEEDSPDLSIEGSYIGYLKPVNIQALSPEMAQADVNINEDHLLEIHCYSESLDTIFRLNYYKDHDDYFVCLTGEDFEHEYGHEMSHANMPSNMMGYASEWMYHLENEHQQGDEHFGGFHMQDHSFEYFFQMMDGDHDYQLQFQGIKQ